MRELNTNEIDSVNGGLIPLIYGAAFAVQYIAVAYTGAQIATAAGVAVGFTATVVAATN